MCFRWITDFLVTGLCIIVIATALFYAFDLSTSLHHSVGDYVSAQVSTARDFVRPYAINQSKAAANALIEQAFQ